MASTIFSDRSWIKKLLLDLWAQWRLLVIVLTPLVLCPLPLVIRTPAASCAYVVLIMTVFWLTEVVPLPVTALMPLVLFPLLGVVRADEISKEYTKENIWVFFGSLMMAVAVEESRLHHRIGLFTLTKIGSSPRRLMLGFMVSTCFLSMWMSNTATTAMMVPLVLAVIEELMLVQSAANTGGNEPTTDLGVYTLTPMEAVSSANGVTIDEPKREETHAKLDMSSITEAVKNHSSPQFQRTCKGLLLSICYSANIGGTGTLTGTASNLILTGQLENIYKGKEIGLTFAKWMALCVPQMIVILILSWLWLQTVYIGFRKCTKKQDVEATAIKAVLTRRYKALKPMSFAEAATLVLFVILIALWLFRKPAGSMPGWGDYVPAGVTDGTASMIIGLLLFVVPSKSPRLALLSRYNPSAPSSTPPALLTWKGMQKEFPWGILLLVGGGYAMAAGVSRSGLDDTISRALARLDTIPTFAFVTISVIIVTFITEVTSNAAIAAIFVPIGATVAEQMHINPLYVVLPITIACSFAFMLPVATPPNAVVFSVGLLRVADMAMAGFVMNIICMLILLININTYGCWLFQCNVYPDWATKGNASLPMSTPNQNASFF